MQELLDKINSIIYLHRPMGFLKKKALLSQALLWASICLTGTSAFANSIKSLGAILDDPIFKTELESFIIQKYGSGALEKIVLDSRSISGLQAQKQKVESFRKAIGLPQTEPKGIAKITTLASTASLKQHIRGLIIDWEREFLLKNTALGFDRFSQSKLAQWSSRASLKSGIWTSPKITKGLQEEFELWLARARQCRIDNPSQEKTNFFKNWATSAGIAMTTDFGGAIFAGGATHEKDLEKIYETELKQSKSRLKSSAKTFQEFFRFGWNEISWDHFSVDLLMSFGFWGAGHWLMQRWNATQTLSVQVLNYTLTWGAGGKSAIDATFFWLAPPYQFKKALGLLSPEEKLEYAKSNPTLQTALEERFAFSAIWNGATYWRYPLLFTMINGAECLAANSKQKFSPNAQKTIQWISKNRGSLQFLDDVGISIGYFVAREEFIEGEEK